KNPDGQWKIFPSGAIHDAPGGSATLKLADDPVATRYIRVWMTESSNTCDEHGSQDIRNCLGYAVSTLTAGTLDATGAFTVAPGNPAITTSSIDPWHSAADIAQ